jgi:hypothetical protein
MIRKIISFSNKEVELLDKESNDQELTFTETVRRIVDKYFKDKENENKPSI